MDSHLVAIEIRVEGCRNERVKLDGGTFDQDRLKCLDAQAVQRRRTIQEDGSFPNYTFQRFPNFRAVALDETTRTLDVGSVVVLYQARNHKRTIKLQRHAL